MKINIRITLLLLTFFFLSTAITIRNYMTDTKVLELDTHNINNNLEQKENLINQIFNDTTLIHSLSTSKEQVSNLNDISEDYLKEYIYLYVYKNNKPIFWSTNTYVPPTTLGIPETPSFIKTENISFVVNLKKLENGIDILALIPIEQTSFQQNNYGTKYLSEYLDASNLRLAEFQDNENIRNIYSTDNTFLFSVKLNDGPYNNQFIDLQLLFYLLAFGCITLLITNLCLSLAKNNKALLSAVILASSLLILRIIDLENNWILKNDANKLDYFTPNNWAFLFNVLNSLWLILYLTYIKKYIKIPKFLKKTKASICLSYILISLLYLIFTFVFDHISTLIFQSTSVEQELSQFIYSGDFTLIHISIYCLSIIFLIFLTDFILDIIKQFQLNNIIGINIQLIILIQFIIINAIFQEFNIITILIGLLIITRPFDKSTSTKNYRYIHIINIILLASITNIKFSEASKLALQEQMKSTILTIQSKDDIQAIEQFVEIEKKITQDTHLQKLISLAHNKESENIINEYIKNKYLNGYISKYEFKGYYFQNNTPLGQYDSKILDLFNKKITGKSFKVDQTDSFYKTQATGIGVYEYFTIIRLPIIDNIEATLILDLTNRNSNEFITTIIGGKSFITNSQITGKGSFAIYNNDQLISQQGNYNYPTKDLKLPDEANEFVSYESKDRYFHVMQKNNENETIIVSKATQPYWQFLAVTSILFLLLYSLSTITKLIFKVTQNYLGREFRLRNLNIQINALLKNIRYSTRIQTLVISSVLIAILISGMITYFSVLIQTNETRENNRMKFIAEVTNKLELKSLTNNTDNQIDYLKNLMNGLTDVVVTDFNLFDKNGKLFYTTQPKIYEKKLLSPYISTEAYIEMDVFKKTEIYKEVKIADLKFESAYAPIKNGNYNTIAYLSIPSYNSTEINEENRQILLNTIFNIYTIIIIVFIFLSAYISNKITEPLQIIRKKLSTTNLSENRNEPIYWERNDEIGLLIKDYNFMLIKLEENAKQLRNAEREIAWREMAKQVAHEIKNPLTPMKLGIQHLSRSFDENDPKLKERFKKITTSFIEQIDALANIANEFSVFAKLPDTNLIVLNIISEINYSIETFRHSKNTSIEFQNNTDKKLLFVLADRDQLLRSFNNLLKNAVEAASSSNKHLIKINIENCKSDWIRILINDNGEGIAKELHNNIFKPNFTTKSSGMGLGLAFVKQTVESMGGIIYFETQQNIGTTFYIEVPLCNVNRELQ